MARRGGRIPGQFATVEQRQALLDEMIQQRAALAQARQEGSRSGSRIPGDDRAHADHAVPARPPRSRAREDRSDAGRGRGLLRSPPRRIPDPRADPRRLDLPRGLGQGRRRAGREDPAAAGRGARRGGEASRRDAQLRRDRQALLRGRRDALRRRRARLDLRRPGRVVSLGPRARPGAPSPCPLPGPSPKSSGTRRAGTSSSSSSAKRPNRRRSRSSRRASAAGSRRSAARRCGRASSSASWPRRR